jgi:hypothetical protein
MSHSAPDVPAARRFDQAKKERAALVLRDAEHLRDDREREGQGVAGDELDAPARGGRVQELVRDRLDARLHPVHHGGGERLAHQLPEARVVRRVHVEQVVVERPHRGRHPRQLGREVLGEAAVLEDGDDVVVARDEAHREQHGEPRPVDGGLRAEARVERKGIGLEGRAGEVGRPQKL